MDSYIFFLETYTKYLNRRIAINIYKSGGLLATIGLWVGKLIFFSAGLAWILATQHIAAILALMVCGAGLWGLSFSRARRNYFSSIPALSKNKASLFSLNYQYLRYHLFQGDVRAASRAGDAGKALAFLNGLLETEYSVSIWSNQFIAIMVAISMAVLGGAAGGWSAKYVIGTIFFAVVAIYFAAMVLALRTSKDASMKELKRFLLWLTDEQSTGASLEHRPEQSDQDTVSQVNGPKNKVNASPNLGIVAKAEAGHAGAGVQMQG